MATFVLVHGITCGIWAYKPVTERLRKLGHDVYPITNTGLGERSHLLGPHINLDTHIQDVVNTFLWNDITDAVLVGHSYGGMVITGTADRIPERIRSIVYLDAFLPKNGQAVNDLSLPSRRDEILKAVKDRGQGWFLPPLSAHAFGKVDDPKLVTWIEGKATAQPFATMSQPVRLTGAWEKVPRKTYVLAEKYDPSPFQRFAQELRGNNAWTVHNLPATHFLTLILPDETTQLLVEAAK
jgi:pimeloyl-ACP methyl ester carboxylesterase